MTIRILLIDDHAIVRAGLRALLGAEADFQIVGEAADGTMATHLVQTLHPHIVLLDINMLQSNGIVVTKQLHEIAPEVRVLILTLYEDESLLRQAIENGASGYIVKRALETELISAIRAVHAGNLYVHPTMTRALVRDIAPPPIADDSPATLLSAREFQTLKFIAQGLTNRQIAEQMHLSVRTVEGHRANISDKLGISTPIQFVRYALKHKLIE